MKILFLTNAASSLYGFRKELIKKLIQQGHSIDAFISETTTEELELVKNLGVNPILYKLNRGGLNPFADLWVTYKLAKKIKQLSPDIAFPYFAKPIVFGTLAAKWARVPRIVGMLDGLGYAFTEQPEGLSFKAKLLRMIQVLLYKWSLPKLDKLILLNKDDFADLIIKYNIKAKQTEILGGIGLDLNEYVYSPINLVNPPIKFLFIGRLLKEKGIHEFIAAARKVKQAYPDTVFTVLGSIDKANMGALSENALNELIRSGIIEYPGQVTDVSKWITDHHIFVLPSYREGVPRSTQEAMAIGRPVITTNVAGCRETVEDNLNGFLVAPWNADELAEKMIYFIQHPEMIKKMGEESYQIAKEKFDSIKVNEKLVKMILP
ncbi:glycosyltransferase family 1 protein [Canicola haemoglobinophilus]|uniref:Putative UDP-galactose--lipooligosaccharide galactosyltransferase n=1 Tax=Canicola haemoglobinophilus TaxID=733 RepID=A0A1V4B3M7_9PAST|nr:glycosyltransferase family 4 protein [Canicola haemoglobinophilus]OOS01972.1 glycosyltransferase family 1 protein [Canicola haemoglobinophilus]STO60425.1 putative UDP-galactose--lipooligosaccharide galactosyltransferase [Canicola haemoglobinophilus]